MYLEMGRAAFGTIFKLFKWMHNVLFLRDKDNANHVEYEMNGLIFYFNALYESPNGILVRAEVAFPTSEVRWNSFVG